MTQFTTEFRDSNAPFRLNNFRAEYPFKTRATLDDPGSMTELVILCDF